ncbi:uncharacterized protein LOC106180401 [Lingula anatina]|uniref:Fatty acid synthase n=1 Tax=Lingula anatina TaxID=7574 RepID=A0A1S3KBL5_LINAN|nr:uncharacterized protein LOC106180401 [Lingula anatina]|eukprot:XP_013419834.1 uncharacterized protein LOC106180401 [Lingula anatina]
MLTANAHFKNHRYWEVDTYSRYEGDYIPYQYKHNPSAIAVETASYALLTQMLSEDITFSNPVVMWLTEQRGKKGEFVSTQDTVVALHALAEYAAKTHSSTVDLQCEVHSDVDTTYEKEIRIKRENAEVLQEVVHLSHIWFCGEVVTIGLLDRCMKTMPWIRFFNLYSVSECHDVAVADLSHFYQDMKLEGRKFCPVGKLLPGVKVVILDDQMKPQPVGVPGEIYVGGPTLALGYLNRPELNSERFVQSPGAVSSEVGARLYKTGDWGYMLSDGSFEICGRCDSMVKIRGYSIEIQAVEAAILDLPTVNAAVVIVKGEEGEDKYLVAYIVPEGQTTKKEIRAALKRRLPFYMIPSYFVLLKEIPILASSGKFDKKALPPVKEDEETDQEGAPTTEVEKQLALVWAEVLQHKSIDVQESFFDLGGHSLLATKLLNRVKEQFKTELTVRDLFIHSTVSMMAKLIERQSGTGDTTLARLSPELDLRKEVEMHNQGAVSMDIELRSFWRSVQYSNKNKWYRGRVLLTGATGFLGAFLLRDLLLNTGTHVYCVVRALPEKSGLQRLKETLQQYGILPSPRKDLTEEQEICAKEVDYRVTTVEGDITLVNLGMSDEDYHHFTTEIDTVIHAAAYVNLIYPYQALHGPNTLGTQNVIMFACKCKIKPLHYISTDGVFPHGLKDCSEEDDMTKHCDNLADGYSQSKWVAEQLVLKARSRGLPVAIYRLGNLSGDSKYGYWNAQDFNLLMIKSCIELKLAPDVNWKVEMTPVDFVSSTIVQMTQDIMLSMGKVFHLVNTKPMDSRWLFEWLMAHGYAVKIVSYEDWVKRVKSAHQKKGDGLLVRLLDNMVMDSSFFSNLSTYRNDNFQVVMKTLGLSFPYTDSTLLNTYFRALIVQGVIPKPRRKTLSDKPLAGKVAIVTGASSGIGAAIARHLAGAGAAVAVAARRVDKLKELQEKIGEEGGVAITVKCDVTVREEVKELVQHAECTLGPVDILVNNAGVMYYTLMKNLHEEEWERQIDLNCKGVTNCIGAVLSGMLERKAGHIVNMSSDAGRKGFPGLAVYSGTKFFIEGMSQALRQEVCDAGVRVTCVQPGDVRTELLGHTTDTEAKEQFDGSSSHKILEPEDIGRAVLYAVSQPEYVGVNEILIEPRAAPV